MSRVIGIDPSLSHTALHLPAGPAAIKTSPKDYPHPVARLLDIRSVFAAHVGAGPGTAYIEGYSFGSAFKREQLGELGGALRLVLIEAGWDVVVVPPTTLKKFVVGTGVAEKDRMMLECFKRWGYSPTDNNDCDAYALRQLGLAHQGVADATKAQRECFAKLDVWRAAERKGAA